MEPSWRQSSVSTCAKATKEKATIARQSGWEARDNQDGAWWSRREDDCDGATITQANFFNGPVLIDAVVSRMVLPVPPSITAEMAKGFTLYMLKAIMAGRGDELIDLARTNLWQ